MSIYSTIGLDKGSSARQFHFRQHSSDKQVIEDIFEKGQYDLTRLQRSSELIEFAQLQKSHGCRPLIIDAGANIGAASVYYAMNLPDAHIVAVEAEFENFQLLSKNVEGLNIKPIHAAISSTTGRARVVDPGIGHWGYRTESIADHNNTDTIPCVTINDIFSAQTSGLFPFLVKIDIEGAEKDLFSNNTEWIMRTPIIAVELHDWMLPKSRTSSPFLERISLLDRDFISVGEIVYSIKNDLNNCHP